jgi:hypothetical protein
MHRAAAQPDLAPALLAVREYGCAAQCELGLLATRAARLRGYL